MAEFHCPVPLVLRARAGDRDALERLLAGIQGALDAYLVRLTGDRHLAEDVLQEVFVLIWRKLAWLNDPALFRPWTYRIATREAFRRLQRERFWTRFFRRDPEIEHVAAEEAPEPFPAEWLERLPGLVASVPPASRAVLVLHYLEGMTLAEVAAVLDLAPGTAKSRLAYGLALLRRRLGEEGKLLGLSLPERTVR
jgi:RNA polymerase sigma-70 factor (ECF subfamily)